MSTSLIRLSVRGASTQHICEHREAVTCIHHAIDQSSWLWIHSARRFELASIVAKIVLRYV